MNTTPIPQAVERLVQFFEQLQPQDLQRLPDLYAPEARFKDPFNEVQGLAETLYLDLQPHGLGVSVINPGFVETPLTAQNDFHMPALISPEQAASAIMQGWAKGEFDIHFPKRFTRILKLLRLLPYRLYFAAVRRITGL